MQRFTKIKDSGKVVVLRYTTEEEGHGTHHHEVIREDRPHPDFVAALAAFKPFVAQLCELDEAYLAEARVVSVSVSRKGETRGVMIHCVRPVATATAPFNIHTPLVLSGGSDEDGEGAEPEAPVGVWLPGMDDALTVLEDEAVRYINGKREQGDLFAEPVSAHRRPGLQAHLEPLVGVGAEEDESA